MLLPSLIPCDGANNLFAPARNYIAPSQQPPAAERTKESLSSCRALQAILGPSRYNNSSEATRIQRPKLQRAPAHTQTTYRDNHNAPAASHVNRAETMRRSHGKRKHGLEEPISLSQHSRTFSDASTLASSSPELKGQPTLPAIPSPMFDQENTISTYSTPTSRPVTPPPSNPSPSYSTPKRRRLAPLSMPLGLTPEDFESLNMPPGYGPPSSSSSSTTPSFFSQQPTPPSEEDAESPDPFWTPHDDLILLTTILEKLKLNKQDWNECARVLGKDKDSMGRRWRYLLENGCVGLRRGGDGGTQRRGRCDLWERDEC